MRACASALRHTLPYSAVVPQYRSYPCSFGIALREELPQRPAEVSWFLAPMLRPLLFWSGPLVALTQLAYCHFISFPVSEDSRFEG